MLPSRATAHVPRVEMRQRQAAPPLCPINRGGKDKPTASQIAEQDLARQTARLREKLWKTSALATSGRGQNSGWQDSAPPGWLGTVRKMQHLDPAPTPAPGPAQQGPQHLQRVRSHWLFWSLLCWEPPTLCLLRAPFQTQRAPPAPKERVTSVPGSHST